MGKLLRAPQLPANREPGSQVNTAGYLEQAVVILHENNLSDWKYPLIWTVPIPKGNKCLLVYKTSRGWLIIG